MARACVRVYPEDIKMSCVSTSNVKLLHIYDKLRFLCITYMYVFIYLPGIISDNITESKIAHQLRPLKWEENRWSKGDVQK